MRMRSEQQTDLQPKNQEARCSQSKSILYQVLRFIKLTIAAATIIFLVVTLAIEIFRMFTVEGYLFDTNNHLRNVLTFAVVLRFIRMLINTSLGSILELFIIAITCQVIWAHDKLWITLTGVLCIAGLFAIRLFAPNRGVQKNRKTKRACCFLQHAHRICLKPQSD